MKRRSFLAVSLALTTPLQRPRMTFDNNFKRNDIDVLRTKLKGSLILPGDSAYVSASQPWNLNAQQQPALVVIAESKSDIQVAVKYAHDHNLGVGVMATGHGIGRPCDNGMLINTSRLRGVQINPTLQTSTVDAGAQWKDVINAAQDHGLATLAGSAPHVGVVGYTMGGGFGYLARKFGLNASSVTGAEIVTAAGDLVRVSADEKPDLFWAVKGGGGNFGIVTSLDFKLYPLKTVYGGAVFYAVEKAEEALIFFANWSKQIPDELTAAIAIMNVPNIPAAPEMLRGRSIVVLKACYCGSDLEAGANIIAPLRSLGRSILDTFKVMPVAAMDTISRDPVDPMGIVQYGGMIKDLSRETIDAFLKVAGAGSGSPLLMAEFRTLGGVLSKNTGDINLIGDSNARFSINAIGPATTPTIAMKVQTHLKTLAQAMSPYETGEVFLNFMEVDPDASRVRKAYTEEDLHKLIQLKKKYDPENTFRFNRNIRAQG
jgi:FAD/FMN-containing dehydrogenase